MRISDVDLLIVPGWTNSDADHWQSRWESKLSTSRRVMMPDFDRPVCEDWVNALVVSVAMGTRPVFLIAHSCGVTAVAHAAPLLPKNRIAGAMLVAPPDVLEGPAVDAFIRANEPGIAAPKGFDPTPLAPLGFSSMVIASRSDPFCSFTRAAEFARAWGATLIDAGDAGHINTTSGYGPWPDGVLRLAAFLHNLKSGA